MKQLNWTTLLLFAFFSLTTMADTPPPVCTSANTANRCVQRDGSSRFQIADPSAAQDAATKNYVDTHAVLGPVSSTDTAIALFNGTTGRLLENSSCTIDGSGNIATGGSLSASSINLSGGLIVGGTSEFSTYTIDTATTGCMFYAGGSGEDITCANISTDGSQLFMNSQRISSMADPISGDDAATKNYVDTHTGSITVGTFGSTPTANGATASGSTITLQPADATHPGSVSTTTQSFGGLKTVNRKFTIAGSADETQLVVKSNGTQGSTVFEAQTSGGSPLVQLSAPGTLISGHMSLSPQNETGNTVGPTVANLSITPGSSQTGAFIRFNNTSFSQIASISLAGDFVTNGFLQASGTVSGSNLSGTNTGDVTLGTANGLSLSGQALSLQAATTSLTGALTSTDWNTFNGKQAAGNYITALTSDVSASGPGSAAATVNSVGGSTAANVHAAELLANAATATPFTVNAIVKRDASGWIDDLDPSYISVWKEDFMGYQSAGNGNWIFNADSAGTSAQAVPAGGGVCPDNAHLGCAPMKTGSTTTGRAGLYNGSVLAAGGGAFVLEWLMNLTALSNGTDTYTLVMGFCDTFSSNTTDCTTNSGGYFQYTHSVNSGNLVLATKNGGSKTTTNTSTAMATGWHKFQIQINAAGTLVTGFLDGVSVGTVSATIPTLTTNPFNVGFFIVKSAGTTDTKMNMDYIWLRWKPTTPR